MCVWRKQRKSSHSLTSFPSPLSRALFSPSLPLTHSLTLVQYLPSYQKEMPNYPKISLTNPYLMSRVDEVIIDAHNYGVEVREQLTFMPQSP